MNSLTVEQALALLVEHSGRQAPARVPLEEAAGLVLAEAIVADLDSPPFDKSLVDGFAVRSSDMSQGRAELAVLGEIVAGTVADRPVTPGTTYSIMTGAPIPVGSDAVVMVERSRQLADGRVLLEDRAFRAKQNVMPRGREMHRGQTVLEPGHLLGAPEVGILASVGAVEPLVHRRPSLAVIATGDEIVPPQQTPGPGQIRNSNALTVLTLARRAGTNAASLGIARDRLDELSSAVGKGLTHDVLVLTGGVSMGTRDLVPQVLASHGVEEVFHKVAFKPGKPIWFGKHAGGLVFGLPGNPVSVLVCFELFVRTALRARQGRRDPLPALIPARLSADFEYATPRMTYFPAKLAIANGRLEVEPVRWFGSPDLCAVANADALLVCPPAEKPHARGSLMHVLPLNRD